MGYDSQVLEQAIITCFNWCMYSHSEGTDKKSFVNILSSLQDENFVHHFPFKVFLKVTSQCNLRCKHCFYYEFQDRFNDNNDMSTEELLNLAKFFVEELDVISFTLTGGEPFLKDGILDLICYLKRKNIYLSIITNATLITKEIAQELGNLLNFKQDIVHVSLDGVSAETHDKIRGKGSFDRAVKGINLLKENGVNIAITYTATALNTKEIPGLYELCKDLGAKRLEINRYKSSSPQQKDLSPILNEVFVYTAQLIQKFRKDDVLSFMPLHINHYEFLQNDLGKNLLDNYIKTVKAETPNNLMCHKHGKITISAEGKIYLCPETELEKFCLGSLKKQSFFEIWENRFNNIFFKERLIENAACKSCAYLKICLAGCPASAFEMYKNINCPDSKCPIGCNMIKKEGAC